MKNQFELTVIKYDIEENTKKYAEKKLMKLMKYLPKHAKKSAFMKVNLEELSKNRDDKYQVEVNLEVPEKKVLTVKTKASTILSAIDIAQNKMLSQIRRYKTETNPHLGQKRGLLHRVKRRFMREGK